jgi:hypothetical protein
VGFLSLNPENTSWALSGHVFCLARCALQIMIANSPHVKWVPISVGQTTRSYSHILFLTKFRQIPDTHACVLMSITDIHPGEPITVAYTDRGYYDGAAECLCQSCHPSDPPVAPRRCPPPPNDQKMRKRCRRGGRRGLAMAKARRSLREATGREHADGHIF